MRNDTYEIMEVCLLAGKLMLQCGAETYRVEDTMMRIAASYGIEHSHSFVTPTGIIFTIEEQEQIKTKLLRIADRTTDLTKVAQVNSISRKISSGELTVTDAKKQLKDIESSKLSYPLWIQVIAASISSACFVIMFQGKWIDFIPAFVTGGIGYIIFVFLHRVVAIKFFAEFVSATVMGLLSFLIVSQGFGLQIDKIIIGSVMPLVPGLLITNAVRDLMAGHLVSGLSKGAEAILTAFAIGAGIAVVLSFL
ncbi:threonine/serine exporter family protein [Pseudoneobacillus sp. C159]